MNFISVKRTGIRKVVRIFGVKILSFRIKAKSPIELARKLGVKVGDNCKFIVHPNRHALPDFGSEPYLIEIGNDVCLSFGCTFITHDAGIHVAEKMLNKPNLFKFGRIKIGNNVFIGCKTIIMPNVTISNNVIVGAGSIVTKNIPDGEVWAGNPAKFITTVNEFGNKIVNLDKTTEAILLKNHVNKMR